MTVKKKRPGFPAEKNDCKKGPRADHQVNKIKSNYTIKRNKEDIRKIEQVRNHLMNSENFYYKSFKTDSKIYKELPDLYLNAVKKIQDLDLQVEELQSKVAQLDQVRMHFCSLLEICKGDEK